MALGLLVYEPLDSQRQISVSDLLQWVADEPQLFTDWFISDLKLLKDAGRFQ